MITMRREQMDAFIATRRSGFVSRLCDDVEKSFPEIAIRASEPKLRSMVNSIVDRALSHGITREIDVAILTKIAFEFEMDFSMDECPPVVREILIDKTISGENKAKLISEHYSSLDEFPSVPFAAT